MWTRQLEGEEDMMLRKGNGGNGEVTGAKGWPRRRKEMRFRGNSLHMHSLRWREWHVSRQKGSGCRKVQGKDVEMTPGQGCQVSWVLGPAIPREEAILCASGASSVLRAQAQVVNCEAGWSWKQG